MLAPHIRQRRKGADTVRQITAAVPKSARSLSGIDSSSTRYPRELQWMQTRHPCRSHLSMIATFLVAAVFVIAAPTPTPPVLFAVTPTGAELLRHSPRVAEVHLEPSPFGYLEFDWNAGVPGFGPLASGATALGR